MTMAARGVISNVRAFKDDENGEIGIWELLVSYLHLLSSIC